MKDFGRKVFAVFGAGRRKTRARRVCMAGVAAGALASGAGLAQTGDGAASSPSRGSFSAEYSAGLEFDSNVSLLDIDASTAEGDFAALFDIGFEYERRLGKRTKVEGGYDFGQDLQFDFTRFNTQTHRGSLGVEHDFGGVKGGADYQLIYTRLDGAGFLRFHRFSPYVAGYAANRKLYLRGSYIYTDKNFINRIDRDGDVHAGSIEAFYFINGLKTYLISGYRFESENTVAPEFDFDSHNVKLRLVQRVPLWGKTSKLRVGWRYENRNYQSITPSIGEIRDDVRNRIDASFETPINDMFYTELSARYDFLESNLPSVDFNQAVVTVRIGGRI